MTKPIDFTQTAYFQNIFTKMRIQSDKPTGFHYQPYDFTDNVWNNPILNGIDFTPEELFNREKEYRENGFFYRGKRVIAYWSKQVLPAEESAKNLTEISNMYHLTWCRNLDYLKKEFPHQKIITITCDASTKKAIAIYDKDGQLQEEKEWRNLRLCPSCLAQLDWKGYELAAFGGKLGMYWDFSVEEYLSKDKELPFL